ncbi:hypothetical protein ABW19_dt0203475 [Dactylella cylindrospora]|nr:hypothetical protein ABW19_dt0203475 [Dactylella cylindrospora]
MIEEKAVIFPNEEVSIAVNRYCRERSVPLPEHLHAHADFTEKNTVMPDMMISRLQAQYLIWTARTLGAKKILEIGCFTGFSALALAEAVKGIEGAKIITTDINPETCAIARKVFAETGTDSIITLLEGPAQESIENLGPEGPFDLVFLDANKEGYPQYFKTLMDLKLIRQGGVLIADNVIKRGLVADDSERNPERKDEMALTRVPYLREFNDLVASDPRVEAMILPVFDGLALVRVL